MHLATMQYLSDYESSTYVYVASYLIIAWIYWLY